MIPMTWTVETALPIIAFGALSAFLPWFFLRWMDDSLRGLARAVALSAVFLVIAGAALFAVLYAREGAPLASLTAEPGAALLHFFWLGLQSAIVWLPILLLTALGLGQGIEARRGRAIAARKPDD